MLLLLRAFTNNSTCMTVFNSIAILRPTVDHWSCSHHSLLLTALWMENASRWKSLCARSVLFACNDNDDWCFYVIAIWFNQHCSIFVIAKALSKHLKVFISSFGRKIQIHNANTSSTQTPSLYRSKRRPITLNKEDEKQELAQQIDHWLIDGTLIGRLNGHDGFALSVFNIILRRCL